METKFIPISDIKVGMEKIAIKGIVLNINYKQSKKDYMKFFYEFLIADETASCVVTVFNPEVQKLIEEGDILEMRGVYSKLYRGQLRLNASKNIRKIGDFCMVYNDKINISEIIHSPPPLEEIPKEVISSVGTGKTLEVKRMDDVDHKSPSYKKLEVVRRGMKFNDSSPNGRSSPSGLDPHKKISPLMSRRINSPMTSKPFTLQKKREISNSMKALLELQRKPSTVSVNKPTHPSNQQLSPPKKIFKRNHSPIKPPQPSESLPDLKPSSSKNRIAHHSSSSTSIFRGKDQLDCNRLKNIFHAPKK